MDKSVPFPHSPYDLWGLVLSRVALLLLLTEVLLTGFNRVSAGADTHFHTDGIPHPDTSASCGIPGGIKAVFSVPRHSLTLCIRTENTALIHTGDFFPYPF